MKILLTFLFFISLFFYSSASDDIESVESLTEGREIAPLPRTDERINGYREDYKKPSESLIELPKKYRKKEKEKEKTESVETCRGASLPNDPKPEIKPEPKP